MGYEKRYRTLVPVEVGADHDVARWLARESFEKTVAADCLELFDYTERVVAVEDVPPKAFEFLGRPPTDFVWYEFSGVGRLNRPVFDWLTAETAWRTGQVRAWLDAESKAKRAAAWAEHCEALARA